MSEHREDREEQDRGFKVEDKRRFNTEGARPEQAASESGGLGEQDKAEGVFDSADQPRELTFSSFVIGLASQAFVFLGAMPDPQSGDVRRDLPQAKALIDILSMLSEKTVGNLDEHEARMMEEMLYELRIHYVKELRSAGTEGGQN
jgi:hypothetical protein